MKTLAATLGLLLGVALAAPANADTVRCTDGTTSDAGRGACSHHGGVAKNADKTAGEKRGGDRDEDATTARTRTRHKKATVTRHEEPVERAPEHDNDAVPSASTHLPQKPDASGATARCRDGSLSYSRHHGGTCADHGGVADWLDE